MGTDGKTGSYSLAETHSDILIMSLESTMRNIEQFINFYLIPQLHEYNFDTPLYCEFKYEDMTDETRQVAIDIFSKIIDKLPSGISLEFLQKLQEQMAERLGIDVENFEPNSLTPVASTPVTTPPATNNSRGSKKKELANAWRRPLSDAEDRVDLSGIASKMDTLETEFTDTMRTTFDKVTAQAIKDLKPVFDTGDVTKLDAFKLKFPNEYKNIIKGSMNEAYIYGKKGASAEVDSKIPTTPAESKDFVNTTAQSITDKQLSDLAFLITSTVTGEINKGQLSKKDLSADDIVSQLQDQFDDFFNGKISLTGGVIVSQAINRARQDVFDEYKDKVANYQYSAILDRKTCPLCEKLDGAVLTEAEYKATRIVPPLHFLCRCIWVAILKTDPNVPEASGFADNIADLIDKYQTLHKHSHNVAVA
jgi:SPP1 gp7 family putative phage head morphogenesis protein